MRRHPPGEAFEFYERITTAIPKEHFAFLVGPPVYLLRTWPAKAEQQYRRVSPRFVEMGNNFLKKLAEGRIPELARMPHALDPEAGFRVRSTFTFADFIQVAQPVLPLR